MIRTVLGDVDASTLGRTDYHEHLFQSSPLLPGDDLDDEDASRVEARSLREAGIATMVDATPIGLGRRPEAVARISRATGLGVVATTGVHRGEHYAPDHWIRDRSVDDLTALFLADLRDGQPVSDEAPESRQAPGSGRAPGAGRVVARGPDGEPVRAGVLKAGIGYWAIPDLEHRVLEAVAAAHRVTGVPVMIHLEHGSAAVEVVDLLNGLEVRPDSIALAHIDRNPDPGLHLELARAGVFLGYDGMARTKTWPDSVLLSCLAEVVAGGGGDRILLGGDVARATRYRAYGGMPGLDYLPRRFVPRLDDLGHPGLADRVLRDNPAAWLDWN